MALTRIQLEYFHAWPNHLGLYLAEAQGLFSREGVTVDIASRDPLRGYPLAYLERREVDFGIDLVCNLLSARARGARIRAVASVNTGPIDAILTLRGTSISSPSDLAGRSIGIVESAHLNAQLLHVLRANGLEATDVDLRFTGKHDPTFRDVADGAYDAGYAYFAWEGVLNPELDDRVVMRATDYGGLHYQPYALMAHEDVIDQNPVYVASVVRALREAYVIAHGDRELALETMNRAMPFFEEGIRNASYDAIRSLWLSDGAWGELDDEMLSDYHRWLLEHDLIPANSISDGAYAREFCDTV